MHIISSSYQGSIKLGGLIWKKISLQRYIGQLFNGIENTLFIVVYNI